MSEPDVGETGPNPRKGTRARREQLAALLRERGSQTTLTELVDHFGVSTATMRRDLAALSESGDLVRVYGGAAPARRAETTWREKATSHAASKSRIAQFAASELVHPGDVVFIDAGTTPAAVARQLADRDDITVVVAGLAALLELVDGSPEILVLGGRLRRTSASFLGQAADHLLDLVTPDVAFLGTDHLDPELGANYPDLAQALFKSRVVTRSRASWLVVDESKLGGEPPFRHWLPLSPSLGVVTIDTAAAEPTLTQLRESGCIVHALPPATKPTPGGTGV